MNIASDNQKRLLILSWMYKLIDVESKVDNHRKRDTKSLWYFQVKKQGNEKGEIAYCKADPLYCKQ